MLSVFVNGVAVEGGSGWGVMGVGVPLWIGEDIMANMWGDARGRGGVGIKVPIRKVWASGGMRLHAWLRRSKGSVWVDLR